MIMEKMGEWDQRILLNELIQGRELAKQLQLHLNMPSSSSSDETREFLVQKIQASYEKALSLLNYNTCSSLTPEPSQPSGLALIRTAESPPPSRSESPRSEGSDRDIKEQELKDASKKRKTLPRWTQQVRVMPGTSLEETLDDGFSWRKYGQKDILGAKYPRGYYRCSHRNVQGCLATKQVQRSDNDPTIYEITYRGIHTCTLASSHLMPPLENQEQGSCIDEVMKNQQAEQMNEEQPQDLLLNFQRGLKVITEDLEIGPEQPYPPFPYPSSSSSSSIKKVENNVFSPSVMDNHPTGNLEFVQAATSATNSPTVGMDFPFGNSEFDPNFTFDNQRFFP